VRDPCQKKTKTPGPGGAARGRKNCPLEGDSSQEDATLKKKPHRPSGKNYTYGPPWPVPWIVNYGEFRGVNETRYARVYWYPAKPSYEWEGPDQARHGRTPNKLLRLAACAVETVSRGAYGSIAGLRLLGEDGPPHLTAGKKSHPSLKSWIRGRFSIWGVRGKEEFLKRRSERR